MKDRPVGALAPHVLLLPLLAFAQFISAIDYNIVYVALPQLGRALGFSDQSLQWVVSAYAVAFGGLLLLGGRASDLLGRRRMLALGLALYGAGSLLSGLAAGPGVLVAGRAVQGIGGALLLPAVLSIINNAFEKGAARIRALTVWAAAGAVGMAAGALLGGVLTSTLGWESVFFVNVPLVVLALVVTRVAVPADARRDRPARLDLPGGVVVTLGMTAVVLGLVEGPTLGWTSARTLASLLGGLLLTAVFVAWEARSSHPLMPLHLLRNRPLVVAMASTFVFMGTFGTMYYVFTVYLQGVLGLTPLETGLAFVPWALLGIVGSRAADIVLRRRGVRFTLMGGMLVGSLGMVVLALGLSTGGSYGAALPGLVLLGLGQAMGFASMFLAAGSRVEPGEQGVASAMASTMQQIGSAIGLAVLLAVAAAVGGHATGGAQSVAGLRGATFAAAGLALVGMLVAGLLPGPSRDAAEATETPVAAAV